MKLASSDIIGDDTPVIVSACVEISFMTKHGNVRDPEKYIRQQLDYAVGCDDITVHRVIAPEVEIDD